MKPTKPTKPKKPSKRMKPSKLMKTTKASKLTKQEPLVKGVKSKSLPSNVMVCLAAVLDLASIGAVIRLLGLYLAGLLSLRAVAWWAAFLLLCLLGKAACSGVGVWKAHQAAYACLVDLRLRIAKRLRALPLGFFQTRTTADLAKVMGPDVEQAEAYLAHGLPETMSATLLPAAAFLVVLGIDWRLALAMAAGLPFMYLVKRICAPLWERGFSELAARTTKMQESLMEYVANIPVVKAFGREEGKTEQALCASRDYLRWVTKSMDGFSVPMGLVFLFTESGVALVMIVGTWLLSAGQIDVQRLVLAMVLASLFTSSVAKTPTLQHYGIMFDQAMADVGSILGEPLPAAPAQAPAPVGHGLSFREVSFT